MKVSTDMKWHKPLGEIVDGSSGGKKGKLFLANEFKRLMDPYVPAKNLVLAQNVRVYVDTDGDGVVHYNSPYAHYQYEGEVYGPNFPVKGEDGEIEGFYSPPHKTPTGRKLKYHGFRHPLATDHWDRAMLKDRKQDLIHAYQAWLDERGGR